MASDWTRRGVYRALGVLFRGETPPTNFYVMLITSAVSPSATTTTITASSLIEVANGNGYTTGGFQLDRNSTDFPDFVEAATSYVRAIDASWTASLGDIPASGNPPRWAVLTDDNATVGDREVWAYHDLTTTYSATSGQTITIPDIELSLTP